MLRLERGATGFAGRDEVLPAVDVRLFKAGCHAVARAAGGAVERIAEREYPSSFHSATIATRTGAVRMLCHATHPWIAFVEDGTGSWADPGVFIDPPPWAAVLTGTGFTLLGRELLESSPDEADMTALAAAEQRQIRYWRPPDLGRLIFNGWD